MRLWSFHPRYLDAKGWVVALWREALLAQKVLQGGSKACRKHQQLCRFKQQQEPVAAITAVCKGYGVKLKSEAITLMQVKLRTISRLTLSK